MIDIMWRGKIGYGDILSPICYAFNESQRWDLPVWLTFMYPGLETDLYKEKDTETQQFRSDFIVEHTNVEGINQQVLVEYLYESEMPPDFQHSNYSDQPVDLHNLRFSSTYKWKGGNDHIAFISPLKNRERVVDWKDPLGRDWYTLYEDQKREEIHYETPIKEACEIISTCKLAVTYHGSAAWLCKWIGCPMLIVTNKPWWSQKVFPWSVHYQKNIDLDAAAEKSLALREDTIVRHKDYLNCVE